MIHRKPKTYYLQQRIDELEWETGLLGRTAREAEAFAQKYLDQFKSEEKRRVEAEAELRRESSGKIGLELENQRLRNRLVNQEELQKSLAEAEKKIKDLEGLLNRRSGLEDPYGDATPSSKRVTKTNSSPENVAKRGGAKKGHEGRGRKRFPPDEVDHEINVDFTPPPCRCNAPWLHSGTEERHVFCYIPSRLEKVIYQQPVFKCSGCGAKIVGKAPEVLPRCLYDNNAIAHMLVEHYCYGMTAGAVSKRWGIGLGTFFNIAHYCADFLKPVLEKLLEEIRLCSVVHADESPWMMDGLKAYIWIFANDDFKIFLFRRTRSSEVPKEVFGEKPLKLVLVTDRYSGYSPLKVIHQYCMVHILRDVRKEEKDFPDDKEVAAFASDIKPLIIEAISLRTKGLSLEEYCKEATRIQSRIMDICEQPADHPAVQHIQNIFREKTEHLFQWVKSPDIPADNNYAERGLRPSVIARKISFGSHSERGLETREIIMSVLKTAETRGRDPATFMKQFLDNIAEGNPPDIANVLAIPDIPDQDAA